jgi:hypothetical protein
MLPRFKRQQFKNWISNTIRSHSNDSQKTKFLGGFYMAEEEVVQIPVVDKKWIVIEDIGRDLNPIGWGFKSPVLTPSRFPVEVIGRLITMSGVTKMSEAYEKDFSLRVPIDRTNYTKPFEDIWAELNPDKEFPWAREIVHVESALASTGAAATVEVTEDTGELDPLVVTEDTGDVNPPVVAAVDETDTDANPPVVTEDTGDVNPPVVADAAVADESDKGKAEVTDSTNSNDTPTEDKKAAAAPSQKTHTNKRSH